MTCPKCGSVGGWDGPRFIGPDVIHTYADTVLLGEEALQFECRTCGFKRSEPTKDAPPVPPPPALGVHGHDPDPEWDRFINRSRRPWWRFW